MADNTILIPGGAGGECLTTPTADIDTSQFLTKDGRLGEFETAEDKAIVRANLEVYSKDEVYDRVSTDLHIKQTAKQVIDTHLLADDPHNILPTVESKLGSFVKYDGTTPFIAPQKGATPTEDSHLTTKRFVTDLLSSHLAKSDPHNIMMLVAEFLKAYITADQVYKKTEVYTKEQADDLVKNFVRKDGNTPFTKPQLGATPIADGHLTTKKYVDDGMFSHLVDADPHGYIALLNQRLNAFYKKSETYTKAETYSRNQLDAIITQLIDGAAKGAIDAHVNQYDPHGVIAEITNKHYVQRDGTVPFTAPQKGVDAIDVDELVTKRQLDDSRVEESAWITSGPVQTTVGFVEDNMEIGTKLNLQEIMDAIFYGKSVDIITPSHTGVNTIVNVDMFIRGSIGLVQYAELSQNGTIIGTYSKDDFTTGQLSVKSTPIDTDTTFSFKVYYPNGTFLEATSITKVAFDIFVGIMPKWMQASNLTYEYITDLINDDPINNISNFSGDSVSEIKHKYNFLSPRELKQIFVAIPKSYPDLEQMNTPSQQFKLEAFDIISDIPFSVPGVTSSVIYKIYVYKEALVTLDLEVAFKFNTI